MAIKWISRKPLVTLPRTGTVREAARLMRVHNVGDVIVVEERGDARKVPVGIVTDRDIVVSVLAEDVPMDAVTVEDIMSDELVVATKGSSSLKLVGLMRHNGVKRIPIVDAEGCLESVVSADDLLEVIAREIGGLAKMPLRERKLEHEHRPPRA